MDNDEASKHPMAVGRVIGNLHGLELMLRLFLDKIDQTRYGASPPIVKLDSLKIGDNVSENYFTNYDALGDLVKKYNKTVIKQGSPDLRIDEKVVKARDAFAHGRVLGARPEHSSLRLYKFGRATKRLVPVVEIMDFNETTLAQLTTSIYQDIQKVVQACRLFCPSVLG